MAEITPLNAGQSKGVQDTNARWVPIGNAAARSGCAIETIRFYEKMGILPKAHRTMSERRVYNDADIARISFIRRARELGFSLDQVRSLLTLAEGHSGACEKVHPIAAHHLDEIVTKITALNAMRQVLADLVAQCARGNVSACPLIGVLSGTP